MQYANDDDGNRIEATPDGRGLCPSCDSRVIAKCGGIKVWHWAHMASDCDAWHEDMTQWHIDWQAKFPAECREMVIFQDGDIRRADIALPSGRIIEFQHSPISVEEISERERFYGTNMIWVFDITDVCGSGRFSVRNKETHCTFRWKWARTSLAYTRQPTFLDMGDGRLFEMRKMHRTAPHAGWGHIVSLDRFIASCPFEPQIEMCSL